MMNLKVDYDVVDEIVRQSLVEHALDMCKSDYDDFETADNKASRFAALCKVIEYYSTPGQYREFLDQVEERNQ